MKRIILLFVFMSLASIQVVLATGDEKVSPWAKKAFTKQFPDAQFPKWRELSESEMYIVTFGYNNESFLAYVDRSGVVVATLRGVEMRNLPFTVSQTIVKKYADYELIKVEELTMDSDLSYLVQLKNEKTRLALRVFPTGSLYEIKKERIR